MLAILGASGEGGSLQAWIMTLPLEMRIQQMRNNLLIVHNLQTIDVNTFYSHSWNLMATQLVSSPPIAITEEVTDGNITTSFSAYV